MKDAIKKNRICLQSLKIMEQEIKNYIYSDDFDSEVYAEMLTNYINTRAIYEGLC